MMRYTAAGARKHLSALLNAAERGQKVVIERRGVRFVIEADRSAPRPAKRRESIFEFIDPEVMKGEWTWAWGRRGLRFARRGRAR